MESKLVSDFLKQQKELMNVKTQVKPASKGIVRPEEVRQEQEGETPEDMYNVILEKKPSAKKVIKFLQICIDSITNDDD